MSLLFAEGYYIEIETMSIIGFQRFRVQRFRIQRFRIQRFSGSEVQEIRIGD